MAVASSGTSEFGAAQLQARDALPARAAQAIADSPTAN